MKTLTAVLVLLAVANAASIYDDIDWSTVRPGHELLKLPKHIKQKLDEDFERRTQRIVGGVESVPHSRPFQVALLITTPTGTFFCGGSLISPNDVLTAAHCVETATQVQVVLGAHRTQQVEPSQVRINSTNFIIHDAWNSATLINDIAVVRLPGGVALNNEIQLVPLPTLQDAGNNFSGATGIISGWGLDSDSATTISEVLRQVQVSVTSNMLCNIQFLGAIQASHICTSGSGGVGACSGDSGGPLTVGNMQVGIVSFGLGLGCELGWPSVFTRVTSFLPWIQANTDASIF